MTTLADLVGNYALINGKVWGVYLLPDQPGMAYLRRDVQVSGAKHPSGYRYAHLRRVEKILPLGTLAEPAVGGKNVI
jgi:hypothetical protein